MSQAQDAEMTEVPTESPVENGLAPGEVEEVPIEKLIRVVSLDASHYRRTKDTDIRISYQALRSQQPLSNF
jgi:hypothetical protein